MRRQKNALHTRYNVAFDFLQNGWDDVQRVNSQPVFVDLKVEVGPCGEPGVARQRDHMSFPHHLPRTYLQLAVVSVQRG